MACRMAQATSSGSSGGETVIDYDRQCPLCNKQLCDVKGVKRHVHFKTDETATVTAIADQDTGTSWEKPIMKCTLCDMRYALSSLDLYIRIRQ